MWETHTLFVISIIYHHLARLKGPKFDGRKVNEEQNKNNLI